MLEFEYLYTTTATGVVQIDRLDEVILDANNDDNYHWYLIIHTYLGQTEVLEYGPVIPDVDVLPSYSSYTYSRFDYSEYKISNMIEKFLNTSSRKITQCIQLETDEDIPIVDYRERLLANYSA